MMLKLRACVYQKVHSRSEKAYDWVGEDTESTFISQRNSHPEYGKQRIENLVEKWENNLNLIK